MIEMYQIMDTTWTSQHASNKVNQPRCEVASASWQTPSDANTNEWYIISNYLVADLHLHTHSLKLQHDCSHAYLQQIDNRYL